MGSLLEDLILPVYVRINQRVAAIHELLQFSFAIGSCCTVVQSGGIQCLGIVVGIHHVGHLWVELYLVGYTHLEVVLRVFCTFLGLHQQHAVDTFMAIKGHGSGVLEYGDALHLLNRQTVERALHAVDEYQDVALASGLHATDVKRCASAFLTFEACVLIGVQTWEFAVEGVSEADGRRAAQLFSGDGRRGSRGEKLRLLNAKA